MNREEFLKVNIRKSLVDKFPKANERDLNISVKIGMDYYHSHARFEGSVFIDCMMVSEKHLKFITIKQRLS